MYPALNMGNISCLSTSAEFARHLLNLNLSYTIGKHKNFRKKMTIKITVTRWKTGKRICVSYDSLQYKRRTKTFQESQKKEALDFVVSIPDKYIGDFSTEIWDFATRINHDVLRLKNCCFS